MPPPGDCAITVPWAFPFTARPPPPSTATTTSCTGPVGVGAPRSGVYTTTPVDDVDGSGRLTARNVRMGKGVAAVSSTRW